jgi:hypothetical protein
MIKIDVKHQPKNIHFFETTIPIESKQKLIQFINTINPILKDGIKKFKRPKTKKTNSYMVDE